jgi:hypothetical protein
MSYLDIARAAVAGCEISERSERSPEPDQSRRGMREEPRATLDVRRQRLSREEATALGLNPEVIWMRVSRDAVEASKPPSTWDGRLPHACGWRSLCQSLGPCPRHPASRPCRRERPSS